MFHKSGIFLMSVRQVVCCGDLLGFKRHIVNTNKNDLAIFVCLQKQKTMRGEKSWYAIILYKKQIMLVYLTDQHYDIMWYFSYIFNNLCK